MTEGLEDIAEEMADKIGVYGACHCNGAGRSDYCCRSAFVAALVQRIKAAAIADWKLGRLEDAAS